MNRTLTPRRRPLGALLASFALATALPLSAGCTTTADQGAYGAATAFEGFVPARTAIAPCVLWPAGARYRSQPLSSLAEAGAAELCARLDADVLAAFEGQPYMKGFSPKFVNGALAKAGVPPLDRTLATLWTRTGETCAKCDTAPAFYAAILAKRPAWQTYLTQLSAAARNADALLLPFLLYADERRYDDRGLLVAERRAGFALLLVSTSTGELIWAGGREAAVPNKKLGQPGEGPEPPPWDQVLERLLTEDLWREYPGRQVF